MIKSSRSNYPRRLAIIGVLSSHAVLLIWCSYSHSPTLDEPAHLAAGISHWAFGSFSLYAVNPPLARLIASSPVIAARPKMDWRRYLAPQGPRPEFDVGEDFARANQRRIWMLFFAARLALIPVSLLGACVCYRWSKELFGATAGFIALVLWSFCPNVLAYGAVITSDSTATALGLTAQYTFWRWLRKPSWPNSGLAGICLGLAELSKATWLVLFPLWLIMGVALLRRQEVQAPTMHPVAASREASRQAGIWLTQLLFALTIGVYVLNLGYGFRGTGKRLGEFTFVSGAFSGAQGALKMPGNRAVQNWLSSLRVPLPSEYVEGIDLQLSDFEIGKPSYLRGQWQERGWWYWYLYALAVKVPLGTWGLFLLAVSLRVAGLRKPRRRSAEPCASRPHPVPLPKGEGARTMWRDELVLLAPAAVVLVLVSSQTGFSRYIRYVLPTFPFVFIWISSVACAVGSFARNATDGVPDRRGRVLGVLTAILLAWSLGSSLWYSPHWMSYFNELAGGPTRGPVHLIDAQVDWGQDLLYLTEWLGDHPDARPIGLVYFALFDSAAAGVEFDLPPKGTLIGNDRIEIARVPRNLAPGWYAVSVNFLYGYPHYIYDPGGHREWLTRPYYSYFRRFRPVATAGYSIYIYRLTAEVIEAARRAQAGAADTLSVDSRR